ncbi:MAG: hypothetical protein ACYTF9_01340 [Planctomycetota bacterium]|jgi:hypothetical protein
MTTTRRIEKLLGLLSLLTVPVVAGRSMDNVACRRRGPHGARKSGVSP